MIYVLLTLLVLLALLLLLPIGLELDYSERGKRWCVVWLGLRIPVPGIARRVEALLRDEDGGNETQRRKETKTQRVEAIGESIESPKVGDIVRSITSNVQMFRRGLDAIRSISRHIHVKVHRLDMVVATPNPALTGFAFGMTQAFGHAFAGNLPWHTEPEFGQEEPSVSFRVEVSVTPIMMVPPILRFARHAAKRRAARFRRRNKATS